MSFGNVSAADSVGNTTLLYPTAKRSIAMNPRDFMTTTRGLRHCFVVSLYKLTRT